MVWGGPLLALLAIAGCERPPPPPGLAVGDLPISGSLAAATRRGFTDCFKSDAIRMRCRRHDVMVMGYGPFEAAVDLIGGDGSGGFDQVTFWHDRDQYAVYAIAEAFERRGWTSCYNSLTDRGDQIIYTRKGTPFQVMMDLSYYGKRRLRFVPEWNRRDRRC
ncbi:hypothetical protein [Sphingomonas sp. PB4P5]|uniref:hypothetical protein n=1 Tax=Parasphingomonas puruogangriensis TaxID=3096155 RepID=UPI002FC60656